MLFFMSLGKSGRPQAIIKFSIDATLTADASRALQRQVWRPTETKSWPQYGHFSVEIILIVPPITSTNLHLRDQSSMLTLGYVMNTEFNLGKTMILREQCAHVLRRRTRTIIITITV